MTISLKCLQHTPSETVPKEKKYLAQFTQFVIQNTKAQYIKYFMLYCSNSLSDITTIFDFLCTQELKNWKITDSHILAHFNCSKCVYILKIYFLGNALVCFKFLASSFSLLRPSDYFTNSIQITKHIKKISYFFFLNSFVIIWKYSI